MLCTTRYRRTQACLIISFLTFGQVEEASSIRFLESQSKQKLCAHFVKTDFTVVPTCILATVNTYHKKRGLSYKPIYKHNQVWRKRSSYSNTLRAESSIFVFLRQDTILEFVHVSIPLTLFYRAIEISNNIVSTSSYIMCCNVYFYTHSTVYK